MGMGMELCSFVESDKSKLIASLNKKGITCLPEMNYNKYLRSTLWKRIRMWVLARDNHKCQVCAQSSVGKSIGLEVHHRRYDVATFEGRDPEGLITLCCRCHQLVEKKDDGSKRSCLENKDIVLDGLVSLHKEIGADDLAVTLQTSSARVNETCTLSYVGELEYLKFYSLYSLIFSFLRNHSDAFRLSRGFGSKKQPKSGFRVLDRVNGSVAISVKFNGNQVSFVSSKSDDIGVNILLAKFINKQNHWAVV